MPKLAGAFAGRVHPKVKLTQLRNRRRFRR